jgi:hypothetical protein
MPLQKLQFRPGLNREGTDYANEGGWFDGDKIRFRSGFPEKIGGWTRVTNDTYLGVARALWNWVDLNGANFLGVGTNLKYYIEAGGTYNDVTPFTEIETFSVSGPFAATNGSSTITITTGGYAPNIGDTVVITGAVTLGGNITAAVLNQSYIIASIGATSNVFTIEAKDPVTGLPVLANVSDTGNGGAATVLSFEVPIGLDVYTIGTGWGAGPWNAGASTDPWAHGWGSPYSSSGIGQQLRLWTHDNFGQDLVIAPRGGEIYYWKAATGVGTRAVELSTLSTNEGFDGQFVPHTTNQVVASAIQKFVIAFGANSYDSTDPDTPFNPMLVRWSDQLNQYQWVPDITNQSGEFALTNGSYIVGASNTRQEILIWTDSCLYSMQYLGAPYVWGFNVLMDNISIMSPKAMVTVNNVTYWMGADKFYMYSGRVETLPCALRQYIFADINKDQAYQVFAGSNEGFNEVWWFYVSNSSAGTQIDKYVIYNYLDRVWYYGSMARTAWLESGVRQYPMAANYDNRIVYHEASVDDVSGLTPLPIYSYVQSSDFDIGDGHEFGFVWRILPDINFNGSTVNNPAVTMTVRPRVNSGTPYGQADSPRVRSANNYEQRAVYTIQEFDGQVYTRLRGRQLSFRIESTGLGVAWQLGTPRIDIRKDGRR